jgi:hypothetical protein
MPIKWGMTDQVVNQGVKALVYSEYGMGKTVLCSTAPYPLILSAEAGLLSIRKIKPAIPFIRIDNIDDLTEAHRWIVGSKEADRFWTVCLDSLSEIGEVILAHALTQVKDPRQAYGELIEKLSMVIRAFRDLQGKHVYFSVKMEPIKDDMTGQVKYGPSIPGKKMGPLVPYFFDETFCLRLGRLQNGETYRYLQTQPDLQYGAKDRSGNLDAVEKPDLTHIFNKILSS